MSYNSCKNVEASVIIERLKKYIKRRTEAHEKNAPSKKYARSSKRYWRKG